MSRYREFLESLDARAVLAHYGAENCHEHRGPNGTEIVHSCLLDRTEPHHSHGDSHPSASVNVNKNLYYCYSGAVGCDLLHLIARLERVDISVAVRVAEKFLVSSAQRGPAFADEVERMLTPASRRMGSPRVNSRRPAVMPTYSPGILDHWMTSHPYWGERGISDDAVRQLKLGYDRRSNRVVFPIFWGGVLVGWQKRVIPTTDMWAGTVPDYPKYRTSPGLRKSEVLYNYIGPEDRIVVVESPMSVAKAVSLGLMRTVATFGAGCSDRQIELLAACKHVTVWFDSDDAGRAGRRKLVEGLYRHVRVDAVEPEEGKDLADYSSTEDVCAILEGAVPAALLLAGEGVQQHGQQEGVRPHSANRGEG